MSRIACQKCGFENWQSLYWISGVKHCGECAAKVFSAQLIRLRKRFTKVNRKAKCIN